MRSSNNPVVHISFWFQHVETLCASSVGGREIAETRGLKSWERKDGTSHYHTYYKEVCAGYNGGSGDFDLAFVSEL
jgi:hypothetical protein